MSKEGGVMLAAPGDAALSPRKVLLGIRLAHRGDSPEAVRSFSAALAGMSNLDCSGCAAGHPEDLFAGTNHGSATDGAPRPWDILAWAESSDLELDELLETLEPLRTLVRECALASASAVMAGTCHMILPGSDTALLNVFALRPRAGMGIGRFRYLWLAEHGGLAVKGRKPSGESRRYRQLHSDFEAAARGADMLGLGVSDLAGAAESSWPSPAEMRAAFRSAAVGETALADERRFIDHRRSVLGAYDVLQ